MREEKIHKCMFVLQFPPPVCSQMVLKHTHTHTLRETGREMEAQTNLVDLSICTISDHFHQLENPSRILDLKEKDKQQKRIN